MHVVSSTSPATVRKIRRIGAVPDVEAATSLKKSTLYRLVREGKFPRPIQLTPRRVGWDMEAVEAWIQQRVDDAQALGGSAGGTDGAGVCTTTAR